jgi:hypothetical protein
MVMCNIYSSERNIYSYLKLFHHSSQTSRFGQKYRSILTRYLVSNKKMITYRTCVHRSHPLYIYCVQISHTFRVRQVSYHQ